MMIYSIKLSEAGNAKLDRDHASAVASAVCNPGSVAGAATANCELLGLRGGDKTLI